MRLRVGVANLTVWTKVTLGLAASIELPTAALGYVGDSVASGVTSSSLLVLYSVLLAPLFMLIVVVSARWSLERFDVPNQGRSGSRFTLRTLLLAVLAVGVATWVAIADYRGPWMMDLPRLIWLCLTWFVLNCLDRYLDPKPGSNVA